MGKQGVVGPFCHQHQPALTASLNHLETYLKLGNLESLVATVASYAQEIRAHHQFFLDRPTSFLFLSE